MYLTSKSTARNIQLIFSIGSAPTIDRSWRMKISLLPCDADYLGNISTPTLSGVIILKNLFSNFPRHSKTPKSPAQLPAVHHREHGHSEILQLERCGGQYDLAEAIGRSGLPNLLQDRISRLQSAGKRESIPFDDPAGEEN